ncbi:MAG: hypothetical protein IT257_11365 [Chitinophagaceae bacterium]|nr:hypothetical protein [Chitinophagaceae bacterium]
MKKNISLVLTVMMVLMLNSACNTYRSISSVTKVSQLKGNPFMYQLSKAVLKNVAAYAVKIGAKGSGKVNMVTPIADVFSSEQIGGLKELMTLSYNISPKKMNGGFDKLLNFRDLIMFVGKYGKGFNFYSKNSSL